MISYNITIVYQTYRVYINFRVEMLYITNSQNKFIYKIKGLINKINVNINDFNTVLSQDSIINQTKQYKLLS